MHWKRWLTAIVALPLLFLLILKGGALLFTLFVSAVAVVTLWEYFRIVFSNHEPTVHWFYAWWTYAFGAGLVLGVHAYGFGVMMAFLTAHFIGAAVMSIFRFKLTQDAPVVVLKQVFGLFYIPLFLSCLVPLYNDGQGIHWVFLLFLIIVMGDTGAYYAGSYLGRHKLCPAVSPKKTIEGAVGGLTASLLIAFFYKLLFIPVLSVPAVLLFAAIVGAVGQVGDLFESEFKRAAGVKDSGRLLPGHGGFLDRIDALLFAIPTAYLLKEYLLS
ncbi:MAG: hypothetical protein VR64_20885 [Desulfatitalea sp. BRH_c12]|nr:MAG: hypothetical protein VR64_20885 [Desulfatitalea sp. BRH_c12]